MNEILNYLIEANLALVFFYACFWVLFRKENQFSFKRAYLLGSLVASLLFPLISIPSNGAQLIPSLSNTFAAVWLPEITVYANSAYEQTTHQTSLWQWISYIYYVGIILFILLFIVRIASLVRLFRSSKKYKWKNYQVVESEKILGSFSFFHFIFLGMANELSEEEKNDVLIHEEVHVQKYHSIDILCINVMGIVFWFNPIIHLYRNSLVQIHEFEADARSVEGRDENAYCSLLARVALQSNGYPLANHFTNSFTLKRIQMIKTIKKRISSWKTVTALISVLLIFFAVACQDQINQVFNDDSNLSINKQDLPNDVKTALSYMKSENPESNFEVIELNEEGKQYLDKKYPTEDSNNKFTTGLLMSVVKDSESQRQFMIIGENEKLKRLALLSKNENDVFTIVDEAAKPFMGMETFYKNIAYSIIYPAEARKNKQEGKVFVEFIVETNGDISNVKVAKGVNAYLDDEAIRVFLQTQSKWTPAVNDGQVVKQKLVLPIVFKLSD
jgi:TonB family protein